MAHHKMVAIWWNHIWSHTIFVFCHFCCFSSHSPESLGTSSEIRSVFALLS